MSPKISDVDNTDLYQLDLCVYVLTRDSKFEVSFFYVDPIINPFIFVSSLPHT